MLGLPKVEVLDVFMLGIMRIIYRSLNNNEFGFDRNWKSIVKSILWRSQISISPKKRIQTLINDIFFPLRVICIQRERKHELKELPRQSNRRDKT